ncbi:MAG: hypothetical protein U1U88_001983 [Lawsonella clevelandensis]
MAADIIYDHADDLDPGTARASQLMVKELDKFESLSMISSRFSPRCWCGGAELGTH